MLTEAEVGEAIRTRRIPVSQHGLYRRAHSGRSKAAAIKAHCLECQGWEDGAVKAVRECEAVYCPLHSVRPYQTGGEDEDSPINGDLEGQTEEGGEEGTGEA